MQIYKMVASYSFTTMDYFHQLNEDIFYDVMEQNTDWVRNTLHQFVKKKMKKKLAKTKVVQPISYVINLPGIPYVQFNFREMLLSLYGQFRAGVVNYGFRGSR